MNQLTAVWRQANYATQERVKREWKAQGKDPSYHSAAFTTAVEQILIDHLRLLLDEGQQAGGGTGFLKEDVNPASCKWMRHGPGG